MKVLAVRDDGAQLAAEPGMFYGVLISPDGSGVIPVDSALARGDWRDGDGEADIPSHLSEWAQAASAERERLDQRWPQLPAGGTAEKAAKAAAFILFRAPNEDGKQRYLLQNRSDGTWGLPGGRLHSGEEPWSGALRESEEELGSLPGKLSPRLTLVNDDGMTVHTFVVDLPEMFYPSMDGKTPEESAGWAWVSRKKVADLPLNPAFEKTWDSTDWKNLGKAADADLVKVGPKGYIHGWIYVGTGAAYDGEAVSHPDFGAGKITRMSMDHDVGTVVAHVDFGGDVGEKKFEFIGSLGHPGIGTGLQPRSALSSEPKQEPLKFFDKTASAAMKRLAAAFPDGMKKTRVSVTPKPYDETRDEQRRPFDFLLGAEPPIADAIKDYTNPSSTINKSLRAAEGDLSKLSESELDDIETLDKELQKERLTRPAVVYRGFTATDEKLAQLAPGSEFTDHAYTSTANDPVWAQRFAVLRAFGEVPRSYLPLVKAHGGKPVIMKINVPAGNHVIMGESDINEWVLPRDTTFHVDDVSPDGSLITVSVPADNASMTYGQMTQAVDQYMSSRKAQKKITPAQVERLAGTGDEISFGDDVQFADGYVEKKFNPLELRDRRGRWTTNGVPALILGHPKTAKHVITYVPGVLSTTPDGHKRQIERIKALKDAADAKAKAAGKKEDTAFVLWGYRAPKSLEGGAIRNYGVATAKRLKEYQDKLRAQNPDAHITVVGHSYGSFVSGLASSRHGMKPDDLVLIGSPGVNAEHVSELAVPPDHVWVGAESRDGVTYTSTRYGLGPNPAHPEFGARLFASEHPQKGEYMFRHAHSTYFRSQSQAIPNMAAIFTGDYGAVTPPGITPDPLPGRPGMVDDPRIIDPASMIAPPIPLMLPDDVMAGKARRIVDTNGQELFITDPPETGMYPAAGGGARQMPDNPRLGELAPGGTPYDQAGGEPPHWQPSQNLTAWSDEGEVGAGRAGVNPWAGGTSGDIKDNSDSTRASHPEGGQDDEQGQTGVPPHYTADLRGPGDGKWPSGGHGDTQAETSMPGGATGVAPSSSAITLKSSAEEKVYRQLLENYPPDAIAWVKDAEWAPSPLNVAQSKIDDDAVKSWAASYQQDRVDHFVKKIEAGEHIHPAVSVREPGEDNVKVIDGHHRALAYRKLGLPLKTWLGNVTSNGGPWDETHSSQFHQGDDPANKSAKAWVHELRNSRGEWTTVGNTASTRAEIGRQLDEQGLAKESPLRGVLQHGYAGNKLLLHRDPGTGDIDAGIRYSHQKRLVTQTHHIEINDVRVLPRRQGIGDRMIRQLVQSHPEAKNMAVYGAVEDAIPWYERNGAAFPRDDHGNIRSHVGEWDEDAFSRLRGDSVIKYVTKVGPEGYIHGFICVRPPCGEKPGKIKAADLAVQRDGGVVHRKSGYAVGHVSRDDNGNWAAHHADGTKTTHRGARTEALKGITRRYNSGKTHEGISGKQPEKPKPEPEKLKPAAKPVPAPRTARKKLTPADEVRLASSWSSGYRFGGRTDAKTKRDASFMSELHRMMAGGAPPANCDAGCQDARDFLDLVDQKAEKQDTLYRGMSLTPEQAAQLFPKGETVDVPVASFSKNVSIAKKYGGAFGKRKTVIIRVSPGAKGLDLVPIQSRSSDRDITSIRDEAEVVSGGRFKVENVASPPFSNVINITLTQVDASAH